MRLTQGRNGLLVMFMEAVTVLLFIYLNIIPHENRVVLFTTGKASYTFMSIAQTAGINYMLFAFRFVVNGWKYPKRFVILESKMYTKKFDTSTKMSL